MDIVLTIIAIALLPLAITVCLNVITLFLNLLFLLCNEICKCWFQIILFIMGCFLYQGRDILSYPIVIMLWGALYYIGVQCAKEKNEDNI